MKKITLFAVACVALASCTKEEMHKEPVSLMGYIDIPSTKIVSTGDLSGTTSGNVSFTWSENDEVYIYEKNSDNYATFENIGSSSRFICNDCGFDIVGGEEVYYGFKRGQVQYDPAYESLYSGDPSKGFRPYAKGTVSGNSFTINTFYPVLHFCINNTGDVTVEGVYVDFYQGENDLVCFTIGGIEGKTQKEIYLPIYTENSSGTEWSIVVSGDNIAWGDVTKKSSSALVCGKIYNCQTIDITPEEPED